jgi:hypothetical protein
METEFHRKSVTCVLPKPMWVVIFLVIFVHIGLLPLKAGEVDHQTELESTLRARGLNISIFDQQGQQVVLYKESHALVIGISNYTSGWPKLPGVQRDVQEVKEVSKSKVCFEQIGSRLPDMVGVVQADHSIPFLSALEFVETTIVLPNKGKPI